MTTRIRPSLFAIAFGTASLFLLFARLHTYDEPLERDITTYAVMAHEWLKGRALYADVWDHKPPAIYASFALAELVAGYGQEEAFLLGLACAICTLYSLMRVAERLAGQTAAVAAGVGWTLAANDLVLQANQPNTEVFLNLFSSLAFLGWLRWDPAGASRRSALGVGAAIGLATLYKPNVAILLPLGLAAHIATARNRRRACADGVLCSAGALLVVGAAMLAIVASGRFADFYDAVVGYNRTYLRHGAEIAGELPWSRRFLPPFLYAFFPLFGMAIAAGIRRWRTQRREVALFAAWAVASVTAVWLPGWYYAHYYQVLIPVAVTGAAWFAGVPWPRRQRWSWPITIAAATAILAFHELPNFSVPADGWSELKYGRVFVETRDLSRSLPQILRPGELFYEWGADTGLYFWTQQSPVTRIFYHYPLIGAEPGDRDVARTIETLHSARPDLVIVGELGQSSASGLGLVEHPISRWVMENYRWFLATRGDAPFYLLARRGSALDLRVRNAIPAERES